MKVRNFLFAVIGLVFPVVFNIIYFIVVKEHSELTWISFAAINGAYFIFWAICFLERRKKELVEGKRVIYAVSFLYFLAVFVFSMFAIFMQLNPSQSVIADVVMTGLFVLLLSVFGIANIHTAENLARQKEERRFVHELQDELAGIGEMNLSRELEEKIRGLYDLIQTSPTRMDENMAMLEERIIARTVELRNYCKQEESETQAIALAEEIRCLILERNHKLKHIEG